MGRETPSFLDTGGRAPLGQLRSRGATFTLLSALIVRVPFRAEVGLRLLTWSNMLVDFAVMQGLNWFDNFHFSLFTLFGGGVAYGNHTALRNFAFLWLAFNVWEHFKRIDEEKRGVEPHNFAPGRSRLGLGDLLPWSPKVIAVAVEPGLAFLAGALLRRLGFSMLGWVVIVSALSFSISEWQLFQQTKEHRRDRRDLGKEAEWEADLANDSAGRGEAVDESEAMSTGTDGLESEIRSRRRAAASQASRGGER